VKGAKKTVQTIFAMLLAGGVISVGPWAFAQANDSSGSVRDFSSHPGISGVIPTIKDEGTGTPAPAGAGTTDALDDYSASIPAPESDAIEASKPGSNNILAPDRIVLSDGTPTRVVNFSMNAKAWLPEKPAETTKVMSWETGTGKSYLIPALEIPAFIILLNSYDRHAYPDEVEDGKKVYDTDLSTFWDHVVHGPWGVDRDGFVMNQFNHPYQGTLYHGFARSTGLNYWESLLYDNLGSFLWETGGETTHPSVNDQVASGIGGSFFGEVLFRMAGLMLEGDGSEPGFWRELGATMLSPSSGINRFAFGNRFKSVFPSYDPATFYRLRLGLSMNSDLYDRGESRTTKENEATLDFSMSYGLPGKPGYSYARPFDYFQFELTTLGNTDNIFENAMIRGLLLGEAYEVGNAYRGIWGLYGGYD